jgi:hypothetical protein
MNLHVGGTLESQILDFEVLDFDISGMKLGGCESAESAFI